MTYQFFLEYYFDPASIPSNYKEFADVSPNYRVGVVTYDNFYSHEELLKIEEHTFETERKCFAGNDFMISSI